jgi:uncharacterized membrane protein
VTTFTVWKFDDPDDAGRAERALKGAEANGLVKIHDLAVVRWPVGAEHPTTARSHEETWRGTGWGAVCGVLVGALFFVPVMGGVAGAALGALHKVSEGTGITGDQLETIRAQVTEGTSALFVVTEHGDLDRLGERFRGMHSTLIATNLTEAERDVLLEAFSGLTG